MELEWKHVFPTEEGWYWFYGIRFDGEKQYELQSCHVFAIANGNAVVGNGSFMFEKELGSQWAFAKIPAVELPKLNNE